MAILVALGVVALLMIPWCFLFKAWKSRFLPAIGASVFAIAAVLWGLMAFTKWALYDGGHGRPPEQAPWENWLKFAAINAMLAVAAAIPGGFLGRVTVWLIGRKTPPNDKENLVPDSRIAWTIAFRVKP